jgi:hypothetical protein
MNRADKGEMDYAKIVADIKQKCEARNYIFWLVNVTGQMVKSYEQELRVGEGRDESSQLNL